MRPLRTEGGSKVDRETLDAWMRAEKLDGESDLRDLFLSQNGGRIVGARAKLPDGSWTSGLEFIPLAEVSRFRSLQDVPEWGIPFVRDGVGNLFLLATSASTGGVWFFDHDTAQTIKVTPSVAAFFEALRVAEVPPSAFDAMKAGVELEQLIASFDPSALRMEDALSAKRIDVVRWLVSAGVSPNGKLHLAAKSPDLLRLLLDLGCDPNEVGSDGTTPLMQAARVACPESVRVLLANGADRSAQNAAGKTALDIARAVRFLRTKAHDEIVEILVTASPEP